MGKKVVVHTILKKAAKIFTLREATETKPVKETYGSTWIPQALEEPRGGWIVGTRWLNEGYREFVGPEEGYCFNTKGHIECLMVCFWPTEKPVPIPLAGYETPIFLSPEYKDGVLQKGTEIYWGIPWQGHVIRQFPPYCSSWGVGKQRREMLEHYSKQVKSFGRKANGQFAKGG